MYRLALVALALTGCATMLNDKTAPVAVTSNPPGALIYANGIPMGNTPLTLYLDNTESHQIRLEAQGYAPAGCYLSTSIGAGWVVLDILLWIFPVVVDAVTGDWNSLDETACHVQLHPYQQPYPPQQQQPYPPQQQQPYPPQQQQPYPPPPQQQQPR